MRSHTFGKLTYITVLCFATTLVSQAQTFTTLMQFNGTNGGWNSSALVQGGNGNLWGSTGSFGRYGFGTLFEIAPKGQLTDVHDFCSPTTCTDGTNPNAPLLLAGDGNFYGTTNGGPGDSTGGTVFRITPSGQIVTLYTFCSLANCADGLGPSGLVQGRNGNLYGTTSGGGAAANCVTGSCGTIFEVTLTGTLTTLYNFCTQTNCNDGYAPTSVILGTDGNFYGTASQGGLNNAGTFFAMNSSGQLSVQHQFNPSADGSIPSNLVQGNDGNFYGTTRGGGPFGNNGTVFQLTSLGQINVLHNFCAVTSCSDGQQPQQGLILGTDGNFYGTTASGGANQNCGASHGCGTVFEITPTGQLTTLHSFCAQSGCPDGSAPMAPLVQRTDGSFYGTTFAGGAAGTCFGSGCGTAFNISTGLAPFVSLSPSVGKVGYLIRILGGSLTGTKSVTFNGVPASFTVVSGTQIKATVPTGATTGQIKVTTTSGTLNSNVAFQVLP